MLTIQTLSALKNNMLDEEEALSLLKAVFNHSNDSKKLTYTGMKKVL